MIKGKHIKELVESHIPELKGHVYPLETPETKRTSVYYSITPVDGGYVPQVRLQLNLVGKDYDELEELADKLTSIFNTYENEPTPTVENIAFRGSSAGGGVLSLHEYGLYNISRIFILKIKERGA